MEIQQKIDQLTPEEISQMLESEDVFASLFYSLDTIKQQKQVHDDLITENHNIAVENMSRAQEINDLKSRILKLQEQSFKQRQQLDDLLNHQQQELDRFSTSNVTSMLRELVSISDQETEQICVLFLDGKITEAEFIRMFKEARRVYYGRHMKLEKLS